MSIVAEIRDGYDNKKKLPLYDRENERGIVVYTDELHQGLSSIVPYFNPTYGIAMNQNGAFSGTPDNVHNGLDNVYWTGSNVVGAKVTFNSGDQFYDGIQSVKIDNPSLNNIWQFDKGSDLTISNYVAITMFIYVDKDWSTGDCVSLYVWDSNTATQVGVSVNLEDYINSDDFDVWQSAVIPFTDLGISTGTFDIIRMEHTVKGAGKSPKFYIDVLDVEELGESINYDVRPAKGTNLYLSRLIFTFASVGTGGTALSYDKFGSLTSLLNGINISNQSSGIPGFTATFRNLGDMLAAAGTLENVIDDGVNTFYTIALNIYNTKEVRLESKEDDFFRVTVNDDLTSLLLFRAVIFGWEEKID